MAANWRRIRAEYRQINALGVANEVPLNLPLSLAHPAATPVHHFAAAVVVTAAGRSACRVISAPAVNAGAAENCRQ